MDTASWLTMTNGLLLAAGVVIGVLAGHFLSPALGEAKRLRGELDKLQGEHDQYRSSVNSHFRKTADLVGQMTKSYAAVYDHLAGGAQRFCDDAGAESQLPFGPSPGQLASPVIEAEAGEDAAAGEPAPAAGADASFQADESSAAVGEDSFASADSGDSKEYAAADSMPDTEQDTEVAADGADEDVSRPSTV